MVVPDLPLRQCADKYLCSPQALVPLLTNYRNELHTDDFLARFCTALAPEKPQLIALVLALAECDDKHVQGEVCFIPPHFLSISF